MKKTPSYSSTVLHAYSCFTFFIQCYTEISDLGDDLLVWLGSGKQEREYQEYDPLWV
jgi:hypothetical protein